MTGSDNVVVHIPVLTPYMASRTDFCPWKQRLRIRQSKVLSRVGCGSDTLKMAIVPRLGGAVASFAAHPFCDLRCDLLLADISVGIVARQTILEALSIDYLSVF